MRVIKCPKMVKSISVKDLNFEKKSKIKSFYKQVKSSVCLRPVFVSVSIASLLSQVESVSFPQQQIKPVDLWSQDHQVTHVAVQRQMEGHSVHGNPKLLAVHPVHEGEDQDPTRKETQEDNDAVDSVQPGVVKAQLDIKGTVQGETQEKECERDGGRRGII